MTTALVTITPTPGTAFEQARQHQAAARQLGLTASQSFAVQMDALIESAEQIAALTGIVPVGVVEEARRLASHLGEVLKRTTKLLGDG